MGKLRLAALIVLSLAIIFTGCTGKTGKTPEEDALAMNSYFDDLLKIDENIPESLVSEGMDNVSIRAENVELVQTMWYGNSVGFIARVFVESTVKTDKKDSVLEIKNPSFTVNGKTCEGPGKVELIDFNRQTNSFVFAIFFYIDTVPSRGDMTELRLADISFVDEEGTPYKSLADKKVLWDDYKMGKSRIINGDEETVKFIDLAPFMLHIEPAGDYAKAAPEVSLVAADGSETPISVTPAVTDGAEGTAFTWFLEEFADIGSVKGVKIDGKVFDTAAPLA